jgi:hypothetical protein
MLDRLDILIGAVVVSIIATLFPAPFPSMIVVMRTGER